MGQEKPKTLIALAAFLVILLLAPLWVSNHVLSILILVLFQAYAGQAWNIMMGFAGQLSLGHSLYIGLGAYAAGALYVNFHLGAWLGVFLAVLICVLVGALIAFLGFRFSIQGVYFALLTIAFAELTRILFEHFEWVGATAGLFIPVENRHNLDLLNLRGPPTLFYYVILFLTFATLLLARLLLNSRLGYYWRAIREDPEAAQTLGINVFRYKMYAVMLSAGLTGIAGVFYVFYYNNLFPYSIFSMHRSIELIFGTILGGVGTLFGPILGAFVLVPLGEGISDLTEGFQIPGITQIFYGLCVMAIVLFQPNGIWPRLYVALGFQPTPSDDPSEEKESTL